MLHSHALRIVGGRAIQDHFSASSWSSPTFFPVSGGMITVAPPRGIFHLSTAFLLSMSPSLGTPPHSLFLLMKMFLLCRKRGVVERVFPTYGALHCPLGSLYLSLPLLLTFAKNIDSSSLWPLHQMPSLYLPPRPYFLKSPLLRSSNSGC